MESLSILLVIAHPDDEVDVGGTIYKLVQEGHRVAVCVMVGKATARRNLSAQLRSEQSQSMRILGVQKVYTADFPNIKMNTVPHLELVQFIENCITDFKADAIITHHPADVNNDHAMTSLAAQAACRLFQRRENIKRLRLFMYFESACATEWSLDSSSNRFAPNTYVEIGKEGFAKKMEALEAYSGVKRPYPHPQSIESYEGLASYRGTQAGMKYAEAFECVFRSV